MKLRFLFLTYFSFAGTLLLAQKGNIYIDSTLMQVELEDQGRFMNGRMIKYSPRKNLPLSVFYPDQIDGYSFVNGKTYLSRKVDDNGLSRSYFLCQQSEGDINFFTLNWKSGQRMFVEHEDSLTELSRGNYKNVLDSLIENEEFKKSMSLIKYRRASLKRALNMYNSGYNGFFRTVRKGALLGFANSSLIVRKLYQDAPYEERKMIEKNIFVIGFYFDVPIEGNPHLFLDLQMYFLREKYSFFEEIYNNGIVSRDYRYLASISSLNFPFSIKYRTASKSNRLFLLAGPMVTININNDNKLVETKKVLDDVSVVETSPNNIGLVEISGMVGVGAEHSFTQKFTLGLSWRYVNGIGMSGKYREQLYGSQVVTYITF